MSFAWDNALENFDEACYSLLSDGESLRLAGSLLIEYANRFPDLAHQLFLEKPLHHFDSDAQQRLRFVGLQLLNAQLCVKNEVIVGGWVGQIVSGMWGETLPDGLLPCDGSTHSKSEYPELWAVLEALPAAFIYDQGGDDFITPNREGNTGIGQKSTDSDFENVGMSGGSKTHALTTGEGAPHAHNIFTYTTNPGGSNVGIDNAERVTFNGSASNIITTAPSGSGTPHNNMHPYHVERFAIVARINYPVPDTFRIRQSPDDNCLLEQSFNGGTYWTPAFDFALCKSIRGNTGSWSSTEIVQSQIELTNVNITNNTVYNTNNQPVPDVQDPTDQDRADRAICAAVDILVDLIFEGVLEQANNEDSLTVNDIASAVGDLFGGLSGVLGGLGSLAFLVGTGGTAPIVFGFFSVLSAAGSLALKAVGGLPEGVELDADDFSDEIRDDVRCCIYNSLKGSPVSFGDWITSIDPCEGDLPVAAASAMNTALLDLNFYLQMLGIMGAAYDALENGVIPCPCETDDCVETDFETSETSSPYVMRDGTTFVESTGAIANANGETAIVRLEFDAAVIISTVEVEWRRPKDVPPGLNGNRLSIQDISDSGYVAIGDTGSTGSSGRMTTTFEVNREMTHLQIAAQGSSAAGADYLKGLIYRVNVCYQGSAGFVEDEE